MTHSLVTPPSLKSPFPPSVLIFLDDIMVFGRPNVTSWDVGAVVRKSEGCLYQMETSTVLLI